MSATEAAVAATPGMVTVPLSPRHPSSTIMGSAKEAYIGSNSYYYSFGGKPQSDWSGIEDKKSRLLTNLCF